MKKNMTIPLVLGLALSTVALYYAFRNVPLSDLVKYLGSINYFWVIPSVIILLLSFLLRVVRWQIILASSSKISFWKAFHPLMIGFMINCVLPARLGELARPAILYKNERVPFSAGLATVATERLFDIVLIIVLLACVLSFVQIDPNFTYVSTSKLGEFSLNKATLETIAKGTIKLCLVLIIGITIVSINKTRGMITSIIMKTPAVLFSFSKSFEDKVTQRICTPMVHIVENFASGFNLVKHPKKLFLCLGLSLIIWVLSAISHYVMSLGCPGIELSFFEISAVMIIICFFIALPSVPGFWGLWEAGGVFALYVFGVSGDAASGYTLANHAVQMFPVIIIGIVSAVLTGVNIWKIQYEEKE